MSCSIFRLPPEWLDHRWQSEGVADTEGSAFLAQNGELRANTDGGQGFFYYANESTSGFGLAACASCHAAAGSDADHPGAGDFVYERQTEP